MKKSRLLCVLLLAIALSGCAGSFERPDIGADFGPPPENYEQSIKEYFEPLLRDPESARYRFGTPQKAYTNNGLIQGGDVTWIGWMVDVDVNAKNGFGGYTGAKPYVVLFENNRVIRHFEGRTNILFHRL